MKKKVKMTASTKKMPGGKKKMTAERKMSMGY